MNSVKIEDSWKNILLTEFEKNYWHELTNFVKEEYKTKKIYPKGSNIFKAFELCPLEKTKVVIIGQDPYHGENQANGLCFAVNDGIALPPSLKNIYKEIESDLKIKPQSSGDLSRWAKQGVLLLNSVLSVRAGSPASHSKKGWEEFTDAVIANLSKNKKNVVYILWGKYAQSKGQNIDKENNLILTSAHPSPFSAHMFFGNKHFSKCNKYLRDHGLNVIDWK